jgi:hypothetical protein
LQPRFAAAAPRPAATPLARSGAGLTRLKDIKYREIAINKKALPEFTQHFVPWH